MATALSEIGLTFWSVWCFRRSFDVEEGSWFDTTLLSAYAGEHTSVTIESVADNPEPTDRCKDWSSDCERVRAGAHKSASLDHQRAFGAALRQPFGLSRSHLLWSETTLSSGCRSHMRTLM